MRNLLLSPNLQVENFAKKTKNWQNKITHNIKSCKLTTYKQSIDPKKITCNIKLCKIAACRQSIDPTNFAQLVCNQVRLRDAANMSMAALAPLKRNYES